MMLTMRLSLINRDMEMNIKFFERENDDLLANPEMNIKFFGLMAYFHSCTIGYLYPNEPTWSINFLLQKSVAVLFDLIQIYSQRTHEYGWLNEFETANRFIKQNISFVNRILNCQ
jgi:hypothetical protein